MTGVDHGLNDEVARRISGHVRLGSVETEVVERRIFDEVLALLVGNGLLGGELPFPNRRHWVADTVADVDGSASSLGKKPPAGDPWVRR